MPHTAALLGCTARLLPTRQLWRHWALAGALAGSALAPALAQHVSVVGDRTVAGGNPVNGVSNNLYIGLDLSLQPVLGTRADVVAPASVAGNVIAGSDSRVLIQGGSFSTVVPGYPFSGLNVLGQAQVRVDGPVTLGVATVAGQGRLTLQSGRLEGIQVSGGAGATVNGGTVISQNSFTILEAAGAGSLLQLNGGLTVGAVRADTGGQIDITGGNYSMLHALAGGQINASGGLHTSVRLVSLARSDGVGSFNLVGSGLTLSHPFAGSYYDPTYLISNPGMHYTLTGMLADGTALNGSYFEEGLSPGQMPQHISFSSAVPEPAAWALMLLALPLVAGGARRRQAKG